MYMMNIYCKPNDLIIKTGISLEPLISLACFFKQNEREDILSLPMGNVPQYLERKNITIEIIIINNIKENRCRIVLL